MVRRRAPGSALALSGAPSRTMWPDCCLKSEVDAGNACGTFHSQFAFLCIYERAKRLHVTIRCSLILPAGQIRSLVRFLQSSASAENISVLG